MGHQLRLVTLLLLSIGVLQVAYTSSTPQSISLEHDDIADNLLNNNHLNNESTAGNESGIKISVPGFKTVEILPTNAEKPAVISSSSSTTSTEKSTTSTTSSSSSSSTTERHVPINDEILNDLIEASKHNVALADDPRFNKMLPDKFKTDKKENATAINSNNNNNKSEENDDDYYNYDYDDDYNYDDNSSNLNNWLNKHMKDNTAQNETDVNNSTEKNEDKKMEMKPIKDKKEKSKNTVDDFDEDDYKDETDNDDDDDDDDEDDEYKGDALDEDVIEFNQNIPCPRYCECARNIVSYVVATCSRLDPGTQKFGSDITDLVVADVEPKYPILLGPEYFVHLGLKKVSSIKISNCTVEYMHPLAFHGLDDLYWVNLTNVGLHIMNPETFVGNKKLRMLAISGNDLSIMSNVHYIVKSNSLEELDLSNNNLLEINPTAFAQLKNIVYINLSQNNLQTLPENLFENVPTLEELDLSSNRIKTLPAKIFKSNALSILHLKNNQISEDLQFGTADLQQLDLSFNSIQHVHHGMFDKMTGLTNLNLKGNGITKVRTDSFLTLKNLRHIDLSMNELEQLSSMVFYKNSELDVIRLNDNPRLTQLPPDGFLSFNGVFTVYYLDISNCAIGPLGHKTFSTMPHLTSLKLAWNNINNLERDTFNSLTKLIDLDLSNNLIKRLDELTFMNNNDLTKLNLAGNALTKLSVRLFLPFNKLRELDVSDCELNSLLMDNQYGVGEKYKFYKTLRSFNASNNQIKKISSADVRNFENLRTLDITHNPIKCNEGFQDFISYVSLNTKIVPKRMPTLENLESDANLNELLPHAAWADMAHEICKHNESTQEYLDERLQRLDKELDEDDKHLLDIMENNKMKNILKGSNKNSLDTYDKKQANKVNVAVDDDDDEDDAEDEDDGIAVVDKNKLEANKKQTSDKTKDKQEIDENDDDDNIIDEDNANENIDDDNNDDDDDDDDDEENESTDNDDDDYDDGIIVVNKNQFHPNKKQEEDKTKDKPLISVKEQNDVNDDSAEEDEQIIIERGHIYYGDYSYFVPTIVLITALMILLLTIAKLVSVVMRKRGERYRMALLASHKNSIVYQKLTEDIINPTLKEPKQPKVHKYAPINQV